MASDLLEKGNEEFINENYGDAVKFYNQALDLEKNRDDILCNRAQAYIKMERYKEAVEDSTDAINLNPKNTKAFLRKGTALFYLEDFLSAKEAFQAGQGLADSDSNFKTWIRKCEAELDLKEQNKTEEATVGVSQPQDTPNTTEVQKPGTNSTVGGEPAQQATPQQTATETKPPQPVPEKKKYDWYQTQTHVVVTILYKNCSQDSVKIDIQEKSLTADISLPNGANFFLELKPLAHAVDPDKSLYKVLKSKIEVKLKKKEGIMWKLLEGEEDEVPQVASTVVASYPTSSHYTRNWDKLAKEVDEEEKNEKKEGDAALNDLFKKIYADGTDETKKAMVKSFSESGGTVLSTNWGDIGKKDTDIKPPDGMEYKKWEQ